MQDRKKNEHLDRRKKAQKIVDELRVKKHSFFPSERVIWTVVGSDGDTMVNFQAGAPYCSCDDFHFRVFGGEVSECYHLIAARIAMEHGKYSVTSFHDDEYEAFLRCLVSDIFQSI